MLKFQKKLIVTRDIRNYLNERELFYEKQERERVSLIFFNRMVNLTTEKLVRTGKCTLQNVD